MENMSLLLTLKINKIGYPSNFAQLKFCGAYSSDESSFRQT